MLIWDSANIGSQIDSYKQVPAFENGFHFHHSQGKHYADDGYYYGQKWQCVEYIKRFYRLAKSHEMPNIWGHARDFFDAHLADNTLNPARGLIQFNNHGPMCPARDDILVFHDSQYGHVGIVTSVSDSQVEIIQQNIFGKPRQIFSLEYNNNAYSILQPRVAVGWMRKA